MSSTREATGRGVPARWSRVDAAWLLALRLAFVLPYASHPVGRQPWVDEGAYWTRAVEIRQGGWLPPGRSIRTRSSPMRWPP